MLLCGARGFRSVEELDSGAKNQIPNLVVRSKSGWANARMSRNWQMCMIQVHVPAKAQGFKSSYPCQPKQGRGCQKTERTLHDAFRMELIDKTCLIQCAFTHSCHEQNFQNSGTPLALGRYGTSVAQSRCNLNWGGQAD